MYRIILCLVAVLNFAALSAQKSTLKFNADGNFKILTIKLMIRPILK